MVSFEDHTLDDAAAELRRDNTRTIYTSMLNKPCPFLDGCTVTTYCQKCQALKEAMQHQEEIVHV